MCPPGRSRWRCAARRRQPTSAATLAGAVERGAIVGSAGQGRIASATRADLAEATAVSGKPVTCTDLPAEQYAHILTGAGLPGRPTTTLRAAVTAALRH